jgi:hypothetical protein
MTTYIATWPIRFTQDEIGVLPFCSVDCYLDYFEDGETRPRGLTRHEVVAPEFDETCAQCGAVITAVNAERRTKRPAGRYW